MNPVVVIVAFRRKAALIRLLNSVDKAHIPPDQTDKVKVIISLDGGYSKDVLKIALNFKKNTSKFNVDVIARDENLGLRKHILLCGDYSVTYGSCVVLEDDLIVSPNFYIYAVEAMNHYIDDDAIAGISLYAQRYNEYANLPFEPRLNRNSDVYFMQVACSWGQAWTKKQWLEFKHWYKYHKDDELVELHEVPLSVSNWPESSWKKYYSSYLALTGRYFVYPYISFSSNCADAGGTHNSPHISMVQVPLDFNGSIVKQYQFCQINEREAALYDAYMEPILPAYLFGVDDAPQIDLYGTKPISLLLRSKYSVSSKDHQSPIISYPLRYKNLESNLLFPVSIKEQATCFYTLGLSSDFEKDTFLSIRLKRFKVSQYFNYYDTLNKSYVFSLLFEVVSKFFKGGFK